jgi:signal transduction histidine kinase
MAGHAGGVRLEVLDRGPGLPPAVRDFLAGASTPGAAGAGAVDSASGGLGLRIARSLAEANGGTLHLAPREGGGTAARLDLPAAPEEMP